MKNPSPRKSNSSENAEPAVPKFSYWHEVIDSLFKTKAFKKAGLGADSHAHFIQQINTLNAKYAFPVSEPELVVLSFESSSESKLGLTHLTEKEIIEQYRAQAAEQNQFTIVGDAHTMNFVYTDPKVCELFDLPAPEDFSLHAICGMDDTHELYHPEDAVHTIRFGLAVLLTASVKGMVLDPFSDYYQIDFRMGFESPERFKTIRRICKLSNKHGDTGGTRHVDLWTVFQGHSDFRHVQTKLVMQNRPEFNRAIRSLFYITNCILLDITPRDALFANYLDKYGYKYYRAELNKSCRTHPHLDGTQYSSATGSNIKSNLLKKIDARMVENTKKRAYKAAIHKRSLHFKCGQLGILGMPKVVEDCIWKRSEIE